MQPWAGAKPRPDPRQHNNKINLNIFQPTLLIRTIMWAVGRRLVVKAWSMVEVTGSNPADHNYFFDYIRTNKPTKRGTRGAHGVGHVSPYYSPKMDTCQHHIHQSTDQ
jgi:hypothetical protein